MSKSFKEVYNENTRKASPSVVEKDEAIEIVESVSTTPKPLQQTHKTPKKRESAFANELVKMEVRKEVQETLTKKIEQKLKTELTEKYDKELLNSISKNIEQKIRIELTEKHHKEEEMMIRNIEQKIRIELTEKHHEEMAHLKMHINEHIMNEVIDKVSANNTIMVDAISKLVEKIENLQESLSIVVPTPVVNVTMPHRKLERIVHRDSNGHILKITEQDEE